MERNSRDARLSEEQPTPGISRPNNVIVNVKLTPEATICNQDIGTLLSLLELRIKEMLNAHQKDIEVIPITVTELEKIKTLMNFINECFPVCNILSYKSDANNAENNFQEKANTSKCFMTECEKIVLVRGVNQKLLNRNLKVGGQVGMKRAARQTIAAFRALRTLWNIILIRAEQLQIKMNYRLNAHLCRKVPASAKQIIEEAFAVVVAFQELYFKNEAKKDCINKQHSGVMLDLKPNLRNSVMDNMVEKQWNISFATMKKLDRWFRLSNLMLSDSEVCAIKYTIQQEVSKYIRNCHQNLPMHDYNCNYIAQIDVHLKKEVTFKHAEKASLETSDENVDTESVSGKSYFKEPPAALQNASVSNQNHADESDEETISGSLNFESQSLYSNEDVESINDIDSFLQLQSNNVSKNTGVSKEHHCQQCMSTMEKKNIHKTIRQCCKVIAKSDMVCKHLTDHLEYCMQCDTKSQKSHRCEGLIIPDFCKIPVNQTTFLSGRPKGAKYREQAKEMQVKLKKNEYKINRIQEMARKIGAAYNNHKDNSSSSSMSNVNENADNKKNSGIRKKIIPQDKEDADTSYAANNKSKIDESSSNKESSGSTREFTLGKCSDSPNMNLIPCIKAKNSLGKSGSYMMTDMQHNKGLKSISKRKTKKSSQKKNVA